MSEHLVRLHIPLQGEMPTESEFDAYVELEEYLAIAVEEAGIGVLDGNEVGGGEYTIWLFGPDAGRLAAGVEEALKSRTLPTGCHLYLRHGDVEDEEAREEVLPLGT
jgi:hypothetical protein